MKSLSLFSLFLLIFFDVSSQKHEPFTGKLTYSINIADTSLSKYFPEKKMYIFTNDSLLRIENHTEEFGTQVLIKHLLVVYNMHGELLRIHGPLCIGSRLLSILLSVSYFNRYNPVIIEFVSVHSQIHLHSLI